MLRSEDLLSPVDRRLLHHIRDDGHDIVAIELERAVRQVGRPFDIACSQIDIGNALTDMVAGTAVGATQADGAVKPEATMDGAARRAAELASQN